MKKFLAVVLSLCMLASCTAAFAEGATDASYTYNYSLSVFPTNWNVHTYQTATDSEILDYTTEGLYVFDYNENKDGYKVVPGMAVSEPEDVSADYVGDAWGIAEGDTARAWKITLRDNLKWEDGTPISAYDFVTSAKLDLNPVAQNYRADSFYNGDMIIHNAKNYLYQGQTIKTDNGVSAAITGLADLVKGDDGAYTTADGGKVYIALNYPLDWTSGNTLNDYVGAYGTSYFDVTNWEALIAMADEEGLIPLTDDNYALFTPVTTGNPAWGESEADVPNYFVYEETFADMTFEQVGIQALSDTELVVIMDNPLSGFYLLYSLTSNWLVKEDLYLANESVVDGVYSNSYGTTVDNYMSYGPYKLTFFQQDKQFVFEKNENWHGYSESEHEGQYQTTRIQCDFVEEASTRLEMFLNGQLDTYGLTADDMATYQMSDYTYYATGASTFFIALNPDMDALAAKQAETAGTNKTILTVKAFREAMSFGLDRAAFCLATSPVNNSAFGVFSYFIISDPDNGTAYRTTEQAKQVLANFWGLTDEIGAGKMYETVDDAIDSITGYNLDMAKAKFDEAYDTAIAEGLMTDTDKVVIKIGIPNSTSKFYSKGNDFLVNNYTEAVKGTKLEGKLSFELDDTLGNGFADALRNNSVDMLFGVGWSGSALNPYGLVSAYTQDSYQYDPCWDTTTADLTIVMDDVAYTATVWDWTQSLAGTPVTVNGSDGSVNEAFTCSAADEQPEMRLNILAALEGAILDTYDMIPIMDDSTAQMRGMQINYGTEEYIYGMGFGTIQYYTYNYTDAEWDAFVTTNGGTLNYN